MTTTEQAVCTRQGCDRPIERRADRRKYCSRECTAAARVLPSPPCPECGGPIPKRNRRFAKYCSERCRRPADRCGKGLHPRPPEAPRGWRCRECTRTRQSQWARENNGAERRTQGPPRPAPRSEPRVVPEGGALVWRPESFGGTVVRLPDGSERVATRREVDRWQVLA